jgi:hypothetical protein
VSDDAPSTLAYASRLAFAHGLRAFAAAAVAGLIVVVAPGVLARLLLDPGRGAASYLLVVVCGPSLVLFSPALLAGAPATVVRAGRLRGAPAALFWATAREAFLPGAATLAWTSTLLLASFAHGPLQGGVLSSGACVCAGLYIPGRASALRSLGGPTSHPGEPPGRADRELYAHAFLAGLAPLAMLLLVAIGPRWLDLFAAGPQVHDLAPWLTCACVPLALTLDALLVSACLERHTTNVARDLSPSAPSTETQAPS